MSAAAAHNCGVCLYPADLGVPGGSEPAYVNPICPDHGEDPDHEYQEVRVHQLHEGPLGVCRCGAYRDEHANTTIADKPNALSVAPRTGSGTCRRCTVCSERMWPDPTGSRWAHAGSGPFTHVARPGPMIFRTNPDSHEQEGSN